MEYASEGWRSQIVRGAAVSQVEGWLANLEARPRLHPGASGKPLMWVHLAECPSANPETLNAKRSVGVLPDVLRALDRRISEQDLQVLREIFLRSGEAFSGTIEFAKT